MVNAHSPVASHRFNRLADQMRDKRYRDSYVASHARRTLAQQMRKLRGDDSQASFAEKVSKRQTIISRLENPSYSGWSLRTMLEVAQALDIAVFIRFVDFPTFLKYSGDLSDNALRPAPYGEEAIGEMAKGEERRARESALKALFSEPPKQAGGQSARDAARPRRVLGSSASRPFGPSNDAIGSIEHEFERKLTG